MKTLPLIQQTKWRRPGILAIVSLLGISVGSSAMANANGPAKSKDVKLKQCLPGQMPYVNGVEVCVGMPTGNKQGSTTPLSLVPLTELAVFSDAESDVAGQSDALLVKPGTVASAAADEEIRKHLLRLRRTMHEIDVNAARKFPISPVAVAVPAEITPKPVR